MTRSMTRSSRWLHTPRGLLILLMTIVGVPAATLAFLGLRLLQQDRELERQRRAEILQDASARVVSTLERELVALTERIADPAWPSTKPLAGSVHILLTREESRIEPPDAIAYWPTAPKLPEVPAEPFRTADAAELDTHDLAKALEISRALAASPAEPIRAGALVRHARILRKMGRADEALAAYETLARITSVSINGLPADLQARKTRCALLAERSRTGQLRREATALEGDLSAGRWRLDRENYDYVAALLDDWLGPARRPTDRPRTFAAAVEWLHRQWTVPAATFATTGTHALSGAMPLIVMWRSTGDGVAAIIGDASYVEHEWLPKARRAAAPAEAYLIAASDPRVPRALPVPDTLTHARSPAETGLPWPVTVALSTRTGAAQFESRRRTVLAALAAVLVLVAAGSYVIVRARSREMALARLQSDFVTAVSHEFRTPLTALLQFNDLLEGAGDLAPGKRRTYYQAQRRAIERLNRLVESLLDFGRMEAGRRPYAMERLDAALLVRDVVDEFRDELEGRDIALWSVADPGEHDVEADPEALGRGVWNLLDNAAKYSGEGREIDVTVSRVEAGVSIAVRDRGIGIPAAEQAGIFHKFTRGAAARSRGIRGTGVGLAMVQHIVSGHRGTLKVDSVEHHGSTFTIVLPVLKPVVTGLSTGEPDSSLVLHQAQDGRCGDEPTSAGS